MPGLDDRALLLHDWHVECPLGLLFRVTVTLIFLDIEYSRAVCGFELPVLILLLSACCWGIMLIY